MALTDAPTSTVLHATTVAVAGSALVIQGISGAGKSALALEMMARGALLVSDDRTLVAVKGGMLIASAPDPIAGLIEARGLGLLHAVPAGPTPVKAVLDLSQTETQRLPQPKHISVLGQVIPLLHNAETSHFPAALVQYLKGGSQVVGS